MFFNCVISAVSDDCDIAMLSDCKGSAAAAAAAASEKFPVTMSPLFLANEDSSLDSLSSELD